MIAEAVFEVRPTELMLFIAGGVATLAVLALAIWIFVRATREERERKDGK